MRKILLFLIILSILFIALPAQAQRLIMPGVRSYTTGIDSMVVTNWIRCDSLKARAIKVDSIITVKYVVDTKVTTDSLMLNTAGSYTWPVLGWANDRNTGLYQYGADDIGVTSGGVLGARYNSTFTGFFLPTVFGTQVTPRHSVSLYNTATPFSTIPSFCLTSTTHNTSRADRADAEDISSIYMRITARQGDSVLGGYPTFGMRDSTGADVLKIDSTGTFSTNTKNVYTPSTTQAITAAGNTILANATLIVLDPNANITLTSAPTIANGTTGQILYITLGNAEANTVTLQDQGTLASSNLRLGATTRVLGGRDVLELIFDGTDWIEVKFSNNL